MHKFLQSERTQSRQVHSKIGIGLFEICEYAFKKTNEREIVGVHQTIDWQRKKTGILSAFFAMTE